MKKKFVCLVLSCIFIFSCLSMVHAEKESSRGVPVKDGKPIIFQRDDTYSLENRNKDYTIMSATFDHDGEVYYNKEDNTYYMKGWSTAKGSTGVDLYHYTTADFATFILNKSYGAVTKWGTGKVWATSEDVSWEIYGSTYGRIRYGL